MRLALPRFVRTAALAGGGAIAAAAVGALGVSPALAYHQPPEPVSATASSTVSPMCIPDNDGDCVQTVGGTAEAPAGLNIRSGPGTGYSIVGSMPYHSTTTVFCFRTGTSVNGNSFWDSIAFNGVTGYVSDYWLFTGGNIDGQVDPC